MSNSCLKLFFFPLLHSKTGQAQERKIVNNAPQALIIEPSRELAEQTYNQIRLFKKHLGKTVLTILFRPGGNC